jgi:ABC-type polysaccharide/polyol phosphate export permease
MNKITRYLKEVIEFFQHIYLQRYVILTLSRRDFERKYIKNFLGMIWAVIDPFAFVVILYIVFGARYGNSSATGVPFVVYLLCGYIAYDLFNSISSLTQVVKDHSFLLKKVDFRVSILPIIRMFSNLMVHAIVLVICIIILFFNHITPTVYWIQLLYYLLAISVFLVSTAWFTSSVYLFFPDISNVIGIITRVLFFLTPIFYTIDGFSHTAQMILKLNPLYYIVNGYRDSLLYGKGFWEHPVLTGYFWMVTLLMLITGMLVFRKLRPHFADVTA